MDTLKKCPFCKEEIPIEATYCEICDSILVESKTDGSKRRITSKIILILLVFVCGLMLLLEMFLYQSETLPDFFKWPNLRVFEDRKIFNEQNTVTRTDIELFKMCEEPVKKHLPMTEEQISNRTNLFAKYDSTSMEFIKGGIFTMGNVFPGEFEHESPAHKVTLSSFYMGKRQIHQYEWDVIMRCQSNKYQGQLVTDATWYQCIQFCNEKSKLQKLTPCYKIEGKKVTCDFSANGYRLPTEAEWEYAAQRNKDMQRMKERYQKSNDHHVSRNETEDLDLTVEEDELGEEWDKIIVEEVIPRKPSLGKDFNLTEWCWDWDGPYSAKSQINPTGPLNGTRKIVRFGKIKSLSDYEWIIYRNTQDPSLSNNIIGLRLCRTKL